MNATGTAKAHSSSSKSNVVYPTVTIQDTGPSSYSNAAMKKITHPSASHSQDTASSATKSKLKAPTSAPHLRNIAKASKPTSNRGDMLAEHSFLTDVEDVRQMEQSLLQLLDDFHVGKLQAFGVDCAFEKMDEVRERQERLAKLHFDLDSQQEVSETKDGRESLNKNLTKLMDSLHDLCSSIQSLQKDQTTEP